MCAYFVIIAFSKEYQLLYHHTPHTQFSVPLKEMTVNKCTQFLTDVLNGICYNIAISYTSVLSTWFD